MPPEPKKPLPLLLALAALALGGVLWVTSRPGSEEPELARDEVGGNPPPTEAGFEGSGPDELRQAPTRVSVPLDPREAETTSVALRVLDRSGRALKGARTVAGAEHSAVADEDGTTRLEWPRHTEAERRVALTVRLDGFVTERIETWIFEGRENALGDVYLDEGGALTGVVRTDAGAPVAGCVVYVEDDVRLDHHRRPRPCAFPETSRPGTFLSSHLEHMLPDDVPRARTDANGEYTLRGLAPGSVRLWAGVVSGPCSFTQPLEVVTGQATRVDDLVLETPEAGRVVTGRILAPDGTGVAHARVTLYDLASMPLCGVRADAEGNYTFLFLSDTSYEVVADDPEGRWCPSPPRTITAGERGVDFWLERCPELSLRAISNGEPVAVFGFEIRERDQSLHLSEVPREHPGGTLSIPRPPRDVSIEIVAPGYEPFSFGLLAVAELDGELTARLHPVDALTGRVTAGGRPVRHARVELLEREPSWLALPEARPAPLRSDWGPPASTSTTNASGGFRIARGKVGDGLLRVSAPGWAPARIRIEHGTEVVDVRLTPGGSIRGRLVPGAEVMGAVVAASAGDGRLHLARVEPGGTFLLELLAPGEHQLALLDEVPLSPWVDERAPRDDGEASVDAWRCHVVEGSVTDVELEWTGRPAARLYGFLSIGDWNLAGCRVVVTPRGTSRGRRVTTRLDEGSSFSVQLSSLGPHEIEVRGDVAGYGEFVLSDLIDVAGDRHWSGDLATGEIVVDFQSPPKGGLLCISEGPGQMRIERSLLRHGDGPTVSGRVPSGPARLVQRTTSGLPGVASTTTELSSAYVLRGETVRLTLP